MDDFLDQVNALIESSEMTIAEMIGALEIIKAELTMAALEPEDEEDA